MSGIFISIPKVNADQQYLHGNVGNAEQQLMRAEIRLSNIINRICTGNGCTRKPGGGR